MNDKSILPRAASTLLRQAVSAVRVVVITGPRQAGKSTLVRYDPSSAGRPYLTLDDDDVLLREGGRLRDRAWRGVARRRGQDDDAAGAAEGLRLFCEEYPGSAVGGVLLHGGDEVFWLRERVLAAPWWLVL